MDMLTLNHLTASLVGSHVTHLIVYIASLVFLAPRIWRFFIPIVINFRNNSKKTTLASSIVAYKKDLSKISQVNEFAKYSKIQRKMRSEMDALNNLQKEDTEKTFYYVLGGQVIIYVTAVILFIRLLYILIRSVFI